MVEALLNFFCLALPELVGEGIFAGLARLLGGGWEPVLMSDRTRAEEAAHRLTHARISCWLRSSGEGTNEVMVRTKRAAAAKQVLRVAA